jgi:hypothetical protein
MTIKGDPFWLFPQPLGHTNTRIFNSLKNKGEAIDWIKLGHFRATDSVNYYGTDNFFIIRFRTPRIYNIEENPDQGDPNTDIETFSGIYKVVEVTSKFGVGKFEQELVAILDPEIRLLNVMDQINAATAKKEVPTSPNDLTTTNPFPKSAIKTQKIMGANESAAEIARLARQSTVGDASARLTSNVPSPITNLIPGLPPRYT